MSDLPGIDSLKVAQREASKLRALLTDSLTREAKLEVLAEALRDQRDSFSQKLEEFYRSQAPITYDADDLPEVNTPEQQEKTDTTQAE